MADSSGEASVQRGGKVTQVVIDGTELREVDEIDSKPFTMYKLAVANSGVNPAATWELFRRYSQFHELMTVLCGEFKEVKKLQFPPKVTFGNLAASVVGNRREQLGAWLNALLQMGDVANSPSFLAFMEAREGGVVTAGALVPNLSFQNIHGNTVHIKDYYESHIVLVCVASRYNFQKMTQWLAPAMEIFRKDVSPPLKLVAVSLADLRPVPSAMRGMVMKALKKVDKKNAKAIMMDGAGTGDFSAICNEVCADWTGDALRAMGAEDANWTYRVSIVADGVVQDSFQSSTANVQPKFIAAMHKTVKTYPQFQLSTKFMEQALLKDVVAQDAVISSSGKEVTEIDITAAPAWLVWDVNATKNITNISITSVADGGSLITPVDIPAGTHARKLELISKPGKYLVTLKSPETFKGCQATYRVYTAPLVAV